MAYLAEIEKINFHALIPLLQLEAENSEALEDERATSWKEPGPLNRHVGESHLPTKIPVLDWHISDK